MKFRPLVLKMENNGPNLANTESQSQIGKIRFDQEQGLGSTPNNQNVNYKGFTAMMKPSKFNRLARELHNPREESVKYIREHIEKGGAIGSPFLYVDRESRRVTGHEGRHRMRAIQEVQGDIPIPVHIFGANGAQARDFSKEDIQNMKKHMISETGRDEHGDNFERYFHKYSEPTDI